jgi:hypothetical protein
MFGFFRRLKAGNQLMSSLITGDFDDSELGKQLAAWFTERPARVTQRNMFMEFVCAMRVKPESAAMRLMDCIMKTWGGGQFGDLLSQQLDDIIIFDPPRDSEQAEQQRNAKSLIDGLKQKLQAFDAE